MAVEGQLSHISPYESIRKVRDLIHKGNVHTKEIILSLSPNDITVKDGSSRVSIIAPQPQALLYAYMHNRS